MEPAVGRSVILPELTRVLDLPAADRTRRFFCAELRGLDLVAELSGGRWRGREFVEAGTAQTELGAHLSAGEFFGAEAAEHIADKRSDLTGVELAGVFIRGR